MSITKTTKAKKENRGGKRENSGRKKTNSAKVWATVQIQKETKEKLNLIKKNLNYSNLDSVILSLISDL